jgi:hypothetical protein
MSFGDGLVRLVFASRRLFEETIRNSYSFQTTNMDHLGSCPDILKYCAICPRTPSSLGRMIANPKGDLYEGEWCRTLECQACRKTWHVCIECRNMRTCLKDSTALRRHYRTYHSVDYDGDNIAHKRRKTVQTRKLKEKKGFGHVHWHPHLCPRIRILIQTVSIAMKPKKLTRESIKKTHYALNCWRKKEKIVKLVFSSLPYSWNVLIIFFGEVEVDNFLWIKIPYILPFFSLATIDVSSIRYSSTKLGHTPCQTE